MDVYEVIRICNMHPRVNILNPGPGVGGHCIPVAPWFLVDDFRESPTLQLLDYQKKRSVQPLLVYDPFITQELVKQQYHDFDKFLCDCDIVVIMTKHNHIKQNMDKLKGKLILDCCNTCKLPGVYRL